MKSGGEYLADAERLEQQGKYRDAIQLLDQAIAKDKNFIAAYINRGADKSALGDYKGAIDKKHRILIVVRKKTK